MSATPTTTHFDEVLAKIKDRVGPPRTEAQRKALEAAPAPAPAAKIEEEPAPAPRESRSESAGARRWFTPPVEKPRAHERKVCFQVDDSLAEQFRKLCFAQGVQQRHVIAQLMRGYIAEHKG